MRPSKSARSRVRLKFELCFNWVKGFVKSSPAQTVKTRTMCVFELIRVLGYHKYYTSIFVKCATSTVCMVDFDLWRYLANDFISYLEL